MSALPFMSAADLPPTPSPSDDAPIALTLLGGTGIRVAGRDAHLQRKHMALLTYLILDRPGESHRRQKLFRVFWPESNEAQASASLRTALKELRAALGPGAVFGRGEDEIGVDLVQVQCDALEFDEVVATAERGVAVGLYRGPLLDGLHLTGCAEFDLWLSLQRERRRGAFVEAVEHLASVATMAGHYGQAAEWLWNLLAIEPLESRSVVLLMEALERAGDAGQARRIGEQHLAALEADGDPVPSKVRELVTRLREEEVEFRTPVLPTPGDWPPSANIGAVKEALKDRFSIRRELGSGFMANVYLADDLRVPRQVAVKVLKPQYARTIGPERFKREIGVAARLSHPRIVPLFDAGEAHGFIFYTMPLVAGETLRQYLQVHGRLSLDEAIRIAQQVAAALDYSHRAQVVHRDIKPDNIMVQDGEAMVIDFGIALAVKEAGGKRLTASGMILGTPEYMSPEQCGGDAIDHRADLYSLGCVLYEMLAGEGVFEGAHPETVFARHRTEPAPPAHVLRPTVGRALDRVVATALAKAPEDRFPSAADMSRALADAAEPGPFVYASFAPSDRRRVTVMLQGIRACDVEVGYDDASPPMGPDAVAKRIVACRALAVFLTPAANESERVRDEVALAVQHGKPILTVQLKDAPSRRLAALLSGYRPCSTVPPGADPEDVVRALMRLAM